MAKQAEKKKTAEGGRGRARKTSEHTAKRVTGKTGFASGKGRRSLSGVKIALCAAVFAGMTGMYCFDVTPVSTDAMMPALAQGDIVLSWAPHWLQSGYEPGDVILLEENRSDAAPNFLRLIADDGVVSYKEDEIRIDGSTPHRKLLSGRSIARPVDDPDIWRETLSNGAAYRIMLPQNAMTGMLQGEVSVKDGAFLAGDNRYASYDSRQSGVFGEDRMRGKAILVLESVREDGFFVRYLKWID